MGIYDRDYNRDDGYDRGPGFRLSMPSSMTVRLMLFTGLIYVAQLLSGDWFTQTFQLHTDWYRRPYLAYQLLTYGFLHSPTNLWHIVFNMLSLWFFGPAIEQRYGSREFLMFYLVAIVFAGLTFTLSEIPFEGERRMVGASGATTAIVILFAFNFPHATGMFMMLFPMPMWLIGVLIVVMDAASSVQRSGQVAVTAHLGGALFAALYYKWGGRLTQWLPNSLSLPRLKPGPRLRVHDPEEQESADSDAVDDILRKIQEHGQDSLTKKERRILEQASKEYQKKRGR